MSRPAPLSVLSLNSGSSTLKFGLHVSGDAGIETLLLESVPVDAGLQGIVDRLAEVGLPQPGAIGHRVVHGGPNLLRHALIDDTTLRQLTEAEPFAPLHIPAALELIRDAGRVFSGLPQVACFDTVFHQTLPPVAYTLPIDRAFRQQGIRRYGFHGLSCESIVNQLRAPLPRRLIIAHLGSGASVTAVAQGESVDTSMGLTPSGGVMMGTRSGDIDPGLLIYLLREKQLDFEALEQLFDRRAGLLGVSGLDSDMRKLQASSQEDAQLAIQMFCRSVTKQIAAMASVLSGVDLLVFTGGIGENDRDVRDLVCKGLDWMGAPTEGADRGDTKSSKTKLAVQVMQSQEDLQIARHVAILCR